MEEGKRKKRENMNLFTKWNLFIKLRKMKVIS